MNTEQQLKHRLAMVADDLKVIRKFIAEQGLTEAFQKPSSTSDEGFTNLNNIEIACDLTDDECLGWETYKTEEVNDIIEKLKQLDVDGETMEHIIHSVGMSDQMHRQLVMTKPTEYTNVLLEEKENL